MFTHHVVTSLLMYVAYAYRWTKIGNVILVIMDVVDVFVASTQAMRKLSRSVISDTLADSRS